MKKVESLSEDMPNIVLDNMSFDRVSSLKEDKRHIVFTSGGDEYYWQSFCGLEPDSEEEYWKYNGRFAIPGCKKCLQIYHKLIMQRKRQLKQEIADWDQKLIKSKLLLKIGNNK